MMKKIKIFLLFVAIILVSFNARALDYYLSNAEENYNVVNSGKVYNVERGNDFYVTAVIQNNTAENFALQKGKLTIRYDENVLKIVKYDDGLSYRILDNDVSVETSGIATQRMYANYRLSKNMGLETVKLIEVKFHVLENAKSGNTKVYQMNGEDKITCLKDEVEIECGESNLTELIYNVSKSKDNDLLSLKIDGTSVENFNSGTHEYYEKVDGNKNTVNIEAKVKDSKASVSGDTGTRNLSYGRNSFKITVTSEAGDKADYLLTIERVDARSSVNTLKTLKLSSGILNFKSSQNNYDVTVKNDVDEITITSSLTDSKSKYKEDFTKKTVELFEGNNAILITVIAENGEENTYTINVTRELSSNNTLESLIVNGETIALVKNTFSYSHTVPYETDALNIRAIATDKKATVEIKSFDSLEVGENQIDILVTAENGDKVCYTLYVTREAQLSGDGTLASLIVDGYRLDFKSEKQYYNLKIRDEEVLEIRAIPNDTKSNVTIEGNHDLINGSIIKINVAAENNSITRYFITIEKGSNINWGLIIIIGIPVLILLVLLTIILIRNIRKKNIDKKLDEALEVHDEPKEEVKEEQEESSKEETEDIPLNSQEKETEEKDHESSDDNSEVEEKEQEEPKEDEEKKTLEK